MNRYLMVIALAAVFSVSTVAAIQCYSCTPNPAAEEDCSDLESAAVEKKTCEKGFDYCRKMIQTVLGKTSYVMQCGGAAGGMEKPYYNTANDYVKANVYHCNDKDLCNSADAMGASKMIFASVAVSLALWRLL